MVGTAAPVMKKYIKHPVKWVIKNKIKSLLGKPICIDDIPVCDVGQDSLQGDLRMPEGQVVPVSLDSDYKLSEQEEAEILADIG